MVGSPHRTTRTRRRLGILAALSASALLAPVVAATSATATPSPVPAATFTPVPGPLTEAHGESVVDLAEHDYVEREYFASGEANRYRGAQAGALTTAQAIDGGHDYTTRLLVRTPEDPRDFNGTVVVEWMNVTAGQDIDFIWAESHEYLLREGYAFVALTAQKVGVDFLRQYDPERYGQLSVDADNTDPQSGQSIDDRGDVLAWDVFSQIGQGLTATRSANHPLAGLRVQQLIGAGESQSAGRLTRYHNTIHPMHGVYDGLVYYDGAGQLREDLTTPAVSVNTEYRAIRTAGTALPPEGPYVRSWEVAGTAHLSLEAMTTVDAWTLRDESVVVDGRPVTITESVQGCANYPLWTTVDTGLVINAALDAVDRWITRGTPAPASARFERNPDGTLVRDAGGRVVGGIQLPDYVAPLAENVASGSGPGFCALAGYHRWLTAEELAALYPDRRTYVAQVARSAAALTAAGYLLREDAREVVREAARSGVGR